MIAAMIAGVAALISLAAMVIVSGPGQMKLASADVPGLLALLTGHRPWL